MYVGSLVGPHSKIARPRKDYMTENTAKPIITEAAKKTPKEKPNYKNMRDRDREMVKGIFRFHECPGGSIKFSFRAYKEDDVETYELTDGMVYNIPLGVARHLNKNCWYPVHSYETDDTGKPTMRIGQKVHRCSFQSLDFIDDADFSTIQGSGIVTVEKVARL
jgi:hypothetical protein